MKDDVKKVWLDEHPLPWTPAQGVSGCVSLMDANKRMVLLVDGTGLRASDKKEVGDAVLDALTAVLGKE